MPGRKVLSPPHSPVPSRLVKYVHEFILSLTRICYKFDMSFNFNGYDLAEVVGQRAFFDQYASMRRAAAIVEGVDRAKGVYLHIARLAHAMRDRVADDFPKKDPIGAMNFVAEASGARSPYVRDLAGYMAIHETVARPGVLEDRTHYAGIAVRVLTDDEVITLPQSLTLDAMRYHAINEFTGANPHHVAQMVDAWTRGMIAAPRIPPTI